MAPWGPVMALLELGCCSWTFFGFVGPQFLGPCRQDDLLDDDFASPRGGLDKREHVRLGRLGSSSPPLRIQTFSQSFGRIFTPVQGTPDLSEDNLEFFFMLANWKSSFRPPLLIALALISIRLPLKSPLHLMLIAFVPCRHRFMDLRLSHRPWFHQTLAFNERLQWSWVTVAVRQNASE